MLMPIAHGKLSANFSQFPLPNLSYVGMLQFGFYDYDIYITHPNPIPIS
jgi:hypothetical protein